MLALLRTFSWQELRHHPWRHAVAVLAVALGVALAFSVHLINASALGEFASAVRAAGGEPDLEVRAANGELDEALLWRLGNHPDVDLASPVVELQTMAISRSGERRSLRVLGVDALVVARLAPGLMPIPASGTDRLAILAPGQVFLNPAARELFGEGALRMQSGLQWREAQVAGSVAAAGPPLAVMDIGAAQDFFGRQGRLGRIDLRLRAGVDRDAFLRRVSLPDGLIAGQPGSAVQRVDQLSRAYRVNLTVLALVALFTGAFLVYSVLALGVAKRAQQFALLGVLGLTPRERGRLVLVESVATGVVGSVIGIALGTALAALALRVLGGDLGGGYFPGVAPSLHWSAQSALAYAALGTAAAIAGGWFPSRAARALPPAQTLKGVGAGATDRARHPFASALLLALGAALAFVPPVAGLPVAAYVSIGLLLVGGITALPWLVALVYDALAPRVAQRALPMLAVERARRVRESAAVAVSGVVAALALAVALTIMVASFRDSVTRWLDVLLPADLYLRSAASSAAAETVFLPPDFVSAVAGEPGVARAVTQRLRPLLLDASRPPVTLLARPVEDASRALPLVEGPVDVPAGHLPVFVSEAVVDLYGARLGEAFAPLSPLFGGVTFAVAGVWRDYVRQTGAIVLDAAAYQQLTGDRRANELHLWLAPGADASRVQQRVRELAAAGGGPDTIEVASALELRAVSLRIFDRSFAVTYWLQAVAIGIGLFGVAASFGAQVLARRKEFGLLAHLGLTRRQILAVVAGEGAAWTLIGAIAGIGMGLAVAIVLVHVVNPQSFHWTMDMRVPWARLAALGLAVVAAGSLTAWLAGRAAASPAAVLAVKEDW